MTHHDQQTAREAILEKIKTANGYGCRCAAWHSGECACDADWTDSAVYEAQLIAHDSTTREAELLAVIREMDEALRYVEAHYDGMEKADIVGKAIRLAEQVV